MLLQPMIKYISLVFLVLLSLGPANVYAQTAETKKLLFDALTINDGLSQGMVNAIIQDHFGFLWVATRDGLNRYDGYHFVVYRHDPSDSNSIVDNYVQALFEDSGGRLWLATASQGLDLFDRETETFRHFGKISGSNDPIGYVSNITQDKLGRMWVTTPGGIIVVAQQPASKKTALSFTLTKITSGESNVFVARDSSIWISQPNTDLFVIRFKNGKGKTDYIPKNMYGWYPVNDNGYEQYVRAFGEDTAERKLYLFMRNCITEYDEKKNSFSVTRLPTAFNFWPHLTVFINNKTAWLIDNYQLKQFDITTHTLAEIKSANSQLDFLTQKAVCLWQDRSGIIWIGTTGYGILKHNPRAEKFHHTDNESIHWMQQDNVGRMMLIKEGVHIYFFEQHAERYTGIISEHDAEANAPFPPGAMEAVVQDNDRSYWICKQRLVRYDTVTKTCTTYAYNLNFPIYKDPSGDIWFGSDSSFSQYDKHQRKFIDYKYPVVVTSYPYKPLQAIYRDHNNVFWLGTTVGLLRFDPSTKRWLYFKNDPRDSASLSFNLIFTLCPDPLQQKYLWIGTNGGGVNRFDLATGKVIRYSVKNGLANDVVYGILSDKDGNLWMSTNNGLSRLDRERKNFRNYNANDGLQGNEFNRNAFCKTSEGILYFGGVNGFNYFNPADLNDSAVVPNVMVTDFRISNQPISFRSKNSPLSKPIYLTDKITLPYRENMISFDFVSLDFTNAGKNLYEYKMDGFDREWINSGTNHSATYTNLDPGTYTFEIKGSNSDGIWSASEKRLTLLILPPWYMTWWFRTAVVVIIISSAYAFYRYRLSQALKLQSVRNRIASDLHDEIGSNLSNIFIFSNVAQQRAAFPDETTALTRKISD